MADRTIQRLFFSVFERFEYGSISIKAPSGETKRFGSGQPEAKLIIRDWSFLRAVLQRGDVGLGETYVQGLWDSPDVEMLLSVFLNNGHAIQPKSGGSTLQRLAFRLVDAFIRRNSKRGSRKNILSHYDVGNEFYSLWLDPSMTYSSALFEDPHDTLETAQIKKYDRLLSALPENAERVLEVGCGWGGFAERAAAQGRRVTGITISDAQHAFATRRLGRKADIQLRDYRDISGKFDSIVSIEMIEAVGEKYWPDYFRKLKECLAEGGRAALQVILIEDGSFDRYRRQSDFIRHYTFPGGMLVPPCKIVEHANANGLSVDAVHRFGQDYARTLRIWLERFTSAEKQIRVLGFGDEFLRSWRYYFQFCAAGFAHGGHINVAQIALSHK